MLLCYYHRDSSAFRKFVHSALADPVLLRPLAAARENNAGENAAAVVFYCNNTTDISVGDLDAALSRFSALPFCVVVEAHDETVARWAEQREAHFYIVYRHVSGGIPGDGRLRNVISVCREDTVDAPVSNAHSLLTCAPRRREIDRAVKIMRSRFNEPLSVDYLAAQVCISPGHFCRIFKRRYGASPSSYLTAIRLQYAKKLLVEGASVKAVAHSVGFVDAAYFSRLFRRNVGISPTTFQMMRSPE